jgi:hypothetical protein
MCAFFRHYSLFSRIPKNVLVRTPGVTRSQAGESLSYHIPICKEASKRTYVPHSCDPTLRLAWTRTGTCLQVRGEWPLTGIILGHPPYAKLSVCVCVRERERDNDDAPLSRYRYLSTSITRFQRYLVFYCVFPSSLPLMCSVMECGISSVNIR